eukprot:g4677.t1
MAYIVMKKAIQTVDAARGVIARVLGAEGAPSLAAFHLTLLPAQADAADVFEVETTRDAATNATTAVHLRATSGVGLASAFYYYLRNACDGSVTWGVDRSGVQLGACGGPSPRLPPLPAGGPSPRRRVATNSSVRYMFNFCTLSYSLAFASQEDWAFQVDWLALHGINMPLAAVGTEHVLALTYRKLGLTEAELQDFFPGPAFLGWNRMADMDGPWSGPLTPDWRLRRAQVANATYAAMRSLGMRPVLMGFSGHVPCSLRRVLPDIKLAPRQHWQGFNSSCLLDPADPAFGTVAGAFMAAQRSAFGDWGSGQYYATDQWNEINPARYDAEYLRGMSAAVYRSMAAFDKDAKWVLQAWFLVSIALCRQNQTAYCSNPWLLNSTNSTTEPRSTMTPSAAVPYPRAAAYLSGVPKGKLLILDLEANTYPVWKYTDAFYGHDFVWSVIHNFGEKTGMFGNLAAIAADPVEAAAAAPANFKGIGLAMEGINNNPVVYELAAQTGGQSPGDRDLVPWVRQWVASRYGLAKAAASSSTSSSSSSSSSSSPSSSSSSVAVSDAHHAWDLMTDAAVGGVYTSWTDISGMGVINGGAFLRFVNMSQDLPPAQPPAHNATNEAAVARLLTSAAAASAAAASSVATSSAAAIAGGAAHGGAAAARRIP